MKLLKEILGRIFALWGVIIFVITMLPVFLIMWLIGSMKEPKRTIVFRLLCKRWMQVFFFLTGCRLKVKGAEYFEPGKNYVVICNHNSLFDVPVTTPFIPGPPNKTIAKIEMASTPLFGLIYRRGSILVDRKSNSSRRDSFNKMREVLNLGMHMCIYPEGTRNRSTQLIKEFQDGAFRLAIDTGKPIMPAVIFNTRKVLPPGKPFFFWPCRMEMHFLPPREILADDKHGLLKQEMHEQMYNYFERNYKRWS